MTLECEDANSKLIEVVIVADVDYEERVGNSLLQIWGTNNLMYFCTGAI